MKNIAIQRNKCSNIALYLRNIIVTFKGSKKLYNQYPLGAALLYLRGATQNLYESLSSHDSEIILIRRLELSRLLIKLNETYNRNHIKDSLVTLHLTNNLKTEINLATAMLSDASLYLSGSLALV